VISRPNLGGDYEEIVISERELFASKEVSIIPAANILGPIIIAKIRVLSMPEEMINVGKNSAYLDKIKIPVFICKNACQLTKRGSKDIYIITGYEQFISSHDSIAFGATLDSFIRGSSLDGPFYLHPYIRETIMPVLRKLIGAGDRFRTKADTDMLITVLIRTRLKVKPLQITGADVESMEVETCFLCGMSLCRGHSNIEYLGYYKLYWNFERDLTPDIMHNPIMVKYNSKMQEFLRRNSDDIKISGRRYQFTRQEFTHDNRKERLRDITIEYEAELMEGTTYLGPVCGMKMEFAVKLIEQCRGLYAMMNEQDCGDNDKFMVDKYKQFNRLLDDITHL